MKALILIALFLVSTSFASVARFDGYKVLRFKVHSEEQLFTLERVIQEQNLDQWSESMIGNVDVLFPPHLLDIADSIKIPYTFYIEDVQELIENEKYMNAMASRASAGFFESYHNYDEIVSFMRELVTKYPSLAQLSEIGKTLEGNPQYVLRVTSPKGGKKVGMFYHSLTHSREWVSGATVLYIIDNLLSQYGSDSEVTRLVDNIEWFFVPVVNVDGYKYTWTNNRLWRKNRRQNAGSSCMGVDNNRNWAYGFRTGESPCSETYGGVSAFSEPETKNLADFMLAHPNIKGYIDFHSYSELLMWAYGAKRDLPADQALLKDLGTKFTTAIERVHGKRFRAGPIYSTIYPAYGSSVDWAYETANCTFTYTVELRDTGRYGFILPPNQIIPSGQELFAAIKAMGTYIADYYKN